MSTRSELDGKLWRIAAAGYRMVFAPPICLGGVGVALGGVSSAEEDDWQGSAVSPLGELATTGPDLEAVVDRLLAQVEERSVPA